MTTQRPALFARARKSRLSANARLAHSAKRCVLVVAMAVWASSSHAQGLPTIKPVSGWAMAICEAATPIEQKAYAARMTDNSAQSARDAVPAAIEALRETAPELFELPGWPGSIEDFYRQRAQSWERYSPSVLQSVRDKILLSRPGLFERIALNQCLQTAFVRATQIRVEEATRSLDGAARPQGGMIPQSPKEDLAPSGPSRPEGPPPAAPQP